MTTTAPTVPTAVPPAWANALVGGLLRTPGLELLVGRGLALVTVTGRRTGTRYTTPVAYHRDGDTVTILTKSSRTWWRNLEARPEVELRLAGRRYRGLARATVDDPSTLFTVLEHLTRSPRSARRFYGVTITDDADDNARQARAILPYLAVVRVTLQR
ncbi:MAG TPA: nitroreductase/quinone reductase family protein [Egicoccus sp.]|nr:nitroreductase/quinone reductase family protein [Egicoccus sp.]HSK25106.1 nitroreductase/quinone reductase family protein [Egicoccus sp.]